MYMCFSLGNDITEGNGGLQQEAVSGHNGHYQVNPARYEHQFSLNGIS